MLHNSTLLSQAKRLAFLLVPALFLTGAVFAQPGTAFVSITNVSGTPVNFSDASSWAGAAVPGDTSNVTISNCYMVMDVDMVFGSLTIAPGGYLDFGSRTLTVMDQLLCSQLNGVFNSGGTSTVILKSTVADGGSGTVTVGGGNNVTLYNVQVFDGSVVDFDAGGDGTTETTITNELTMGGGSVVVNPPIYGAASTLIYNATYGSVGKEWTAGASSGKGVPHHVSVGSGGTLSFADTTGNFTCTGDFTMDDASGSLDLSSMLGNLTVDGDFTTGTNSAVTLTMPSTEGKGILTVGEDMTINANTTWTGGEGNVKVAGNLTNDASGVAFGLLELNGGGSQTVSSSNSSALTVDSLVVNNSLDDSNLADGDVTFAVNIDITPGGVFNPLDGSVQLNGSGSTFTMNSDASGTARIATLANDATTSDVNGNIVFERYVPGTASTSWLVMGNYITTSPAMTVQSWINDFGGSIYVYSHDESVNQTGSGTTGWTYMNAGSTLSTAGYGYFSIVPSSLGTSGHTLTNSGTYSTGTISPSLSHTAGPYNQFYDPAGWNLLTNPYPSPIDGDAFISNNTSVSEYYILENSSGNWLSSSQAGALEAPDAIAIGQGFYAYTPSGSGGTASFTPDLAVHGGNTFTRDFDPAEQAVFAVKIWDTEGRYGATTIRLHENSTELYEDFLDAPFKAGASANPRVFSELEDGQKLAVNFAGSIDEVTEVALTIETGLESIVTLGLDSATEIEEGLCVRLLDMETGDAVALGAGELTLELEPGTIYQDRFYLEFLNTPVFTSTVSHCEGGVVHFEGEGAEDWLVSWEELGGEIEGVGCVTNLDPGFYTLDGVNIFNGCVASSELEIADVCMGDFNFNGGRDIPDLLMLLIELQPSGSGDGVLATDCDCDGVMTTSDLLMFLPQFGASCE